MAKPSFWRFFIHQRKGVPPARTADLSGKTVLVTGATSGVGLYAVKHFARMKPARLILACRSVARGKEVIEGALSAKLTINLGFTGIILERLGMIPGL